MRIGSYNIILIVWISLSIAEDGFATVDTINPSLHSERCFELIALRRIKEQDILFFKRGFPRERKEKGRNSCGMKEVFLSFEIVPVREEGSVNTAGSTTWLNPGLHNIGNII
jgi:hypothetical protein